MSPPAACAPWAPLPIWEEVEEFATSCGETAWRAVAKIEQLLAVCAGSYAPFETASEANLLYLAGVLR